MNKKKIIKRPPEKLLVAAILNYFRSKGIHDLLTEVQFCEKQIDIMGFDSCTKKYIAVEAKVSSPSKAFRQAERYKHVADYVYVGVLKNHSNKTAIELSKNTGIGLIFVECISNNRYVTELAIESKKSNYKSDKISQYVWNSKITNTFNLKNNE